ncbi:MAG TPA: 6-carboxytetrahydropterin synthase [Anaerohalosphaeraceae bacterium]|nr:6-carboxytetrahydropterin synthase [Anaerohalosphaeraceae bacterium]HOL89545.1 6-carboxytetrahydropterin synthase [Anaerohalosphaeraceae bacterium]HPP57371.1 6-carboxytetrahydropterin synthase [Anaerohalosphaeraceae bacterium]
MHTLCRQVRFSVNPFGPASEAGFNSYASRPCGDGLAVYLCLTAALKGPVDDRTGFVVNVSEIDSAVRRAAVPIFERNIRSRFQQGQGVSLRDLFRWLWDSAERLQPFFEAAQICRLELALNPFRTISIRREKSPMRTYSERFEFAAMHRLWNDAFSPEENFRRFGKCANPAGHGHNYILEVTVQVSDEPEPHGWIGDFEKVIQEYFLSIVDHKNLNADVPHFSHINPTVENIASYAWQCLKGKFGENRLIRITVWENDRTYCTFREE